MTRKTHVMLDIETLSSNIDAAVVSVGAVRMNRHLEIIDEFYIIFNELEEQLERGRTKNDDTMKWWANLPSLASDPLFSPELFPEQLRPTKQGLEELSQYLKNSYVWGYGSTFDNMIIRSIMKDYGVKPLWHYRDDMDFRTISQLYPVVRDHRVGTYHNALDDAKTQINWLIDIIKTYNIPLGHLN